jgi:hypothetical protein
MCFLPVFVLLSIPIFYHSASPLFIFFTTFCFCVFLPSSCFTAPIHPYLFLACLCVFYHPHVCPLRIFCIRLCFLSSPCVTIPHLLYTFFFASSSVFYHPHVLTIRILVYIFCAT